MTTTLLRLAHAFLSNGGLLARALLLAALTLAATVPLGLVGSLIADRQVHQREAITSVTESWGGPQRFVGPLLVVPYARSEKGPTAGSLTLLPDTLKIDGTLQPVKRRRGLFAVTVYAAALDVVAEFHLQTLRDALAADGRAPDWTAARLDIDLSDPVSINSDGMEIDAMRFEWDTGTGAGFSSLKASLASLALAGRDRITVRFHIAFGGRGLLAIAPLGHHTETTLSAPWPSPSFGGRTLPASQAVDSDGFRASWSVSSLGRGFSGLWNAGDQPSTAIIERSAFSVALITPVDAYRETDRAVRYGILFVGLTFATCLLAELATGIRPRATQYGLIGLALCVFYLLLLSFSEQVGFARAYAMSAGAVVTQATLYTGAVQRRWLPAAAFGLVLAILYAGLYLLLQLEEASLLFGSLLLFLVVSIAMWLTRDLHRHQMA